MSDLEEGRTNPGGDGPSWLRRVLLGCILLVGAPLVLVGSLLLALQVGPVSDAAARQIAARVSGDSLRVHLQGARGSWLGGLHLRGVDLVTLSDGDTAWALGVDSLDLSWRLLPLLDRTLWLETVDAKGVSGRMTLGPGSESDGGGSPWTVRVDQVSLEVDGFAVRRVSPDEPGEVGPWALSRGRLRARSLQVGGDAFRAALDTLHASFRPPGRPEGWGRLEASGHVAEGRVEIAGLLVRSPASDLRARGSVPLGLRGTAPEGLALELDLAPLHLGDLGPFLPEGVSDTLRLRGGASLRTRGDTLHARVRVDAAEAGRAEVDAGLSGPRERPSLHGVATLDGIRSEAWGLPGGGGVLQGSARIDVVGSAVDSLLGTLEVELRREGGREQEARVRMSARADSVGRWEGRWSASARGARGSGTARVTWDEPLLWSLDGRLEYAPPPGAQATGLSAFHGRLAGSGTGRIPDSLSMDVELLVDSARTATGAPVGPGRLALELRDGDGRLDAGVDVAGGTVELEARGSLSERSARLVRGEIEGVDVAALAGDSVPGSLSGAMEGEISVAEGVQGTGSLVIRRAAWGDRSLASGRIEATVDPGEARVRASAVLPDSGSLGLRARLTLDPDLREVVVDSLAWSDLDVRTLLAVADSSPVPESRLTGSGRARMTRGADGWRGRGDLTFGPSRVGTAQVERGRARLGLGPDSLEVEAELATRDAGSLAARASLPLPAGGGQGRGELRLEALDLGALTGGALPSTALRGVVTGSLAGALPDSARGRLEIRLDSSRVAGRALDAARWVASLEEGGRLETDGELEAVGGVLRWEGGASLGARPSYGLEGSVERPPREAEGGSTALFARFGLEGTGTAPDSARAQSWIQVDSALWAGLPVAGGTARAGIRAGVIRLDTLDLRLPGAEVAGGGFLPLVGDPGGEGELRLSLEMTRADLLAPLAGARVLSLGEADLDATARGSLDELELEASGRVSALLVEGVRVGGAEVEARVHRSAEGGWSEGRAMLGVDRIRLPTASVQRVEARISQEVQGDLALSASGVVDEGREVELSARVERFSDGSAVLLERLSLRADADRWSLAHPTRIDVGEGLRVDSLALTAGSQALRARGSLSATGPLDFRASVDSFEISTVADLLGYPDLRGRVSGSAELTGRAESPVGEVVLRSRLEPRGAPPARLAFSGSYADARGSLSASLTLDDGSSLEAGGTLPLELGVGGSSPAWVRGDSLRVEVAADSFPVGWFGVFLDPSALREPRGTLVGRVDVQGSTEAPRMRGGLTLTDGGVEIPALGVRWSEAHAALTFRGTEMVVDSARIRSGDGGVSASGTLTLDRLEAPTLDLTLRPSRFRAVATSAVQATVSGEVGVTGRADAPVVRGRIDVERADLYVGEVASGGSVTPVALTEEDWEELARVFGWERPSRETGPPLLETATLDLQVVLGRASWLRQRANPQMTLQLTGDVGVRKDPGEEIRLVGTVETISERSWVEQFGRRFSIEEGRLTFRGPVSETRVEVVAEYAVPSRENPGNPEVVLSLSVTGTPDDLSLELSSTPSLQASDMVSYLVTGGPANQALGGAGEGGSLTGAGGALALGRLSSAVETYAREQVGLDVVEITTDGLEGVTLLAGRYLSPRLYLGVRQPISIQRTAEEPRGGAPTPELEVELQAARWLLLNLRAGGRQGAEFFVRSSLTYD